MLRPGDKDFTLTDGYAIIPRASFEFDQSMPNEYKLILVECINRNWIKPVANVPDSEFVFDILKGVHV
jgi:hypothetical protein